MIKGTPYPYSKALWNHHMYLNPFPMLEVCAECSKLQENVYFMGSIVISYQMEASNVPGSHIFSRFPAEGILYP